MAGREGGEGFEVLADPRAGLLVGGNGVPQWVLSTVKEAVTSACRAGSL